VYHLSHRTLSRPLAPPFEYRRKSTTFLLFRQIKRKDICNKHDIHATDANKASRYIGFITEQHDRGAPIVARPCSYKCFLDMRMPQNSNTRLFLIAGFMLAPTGHALAAAARIFRDFSSSAAPLRRKVTLISVTAWVASSCA